MMFAIDATSYWRFEVDPGLDDPTYPVRFHQSQGFARVVPAVTLVLSAAKITGREILMRSEEEFRSNYLAICPASYM